MPVAVQYAAWQVTHVSPPCPHSAFDVPDTQVPLSVQHPAQFNALHARHAPPPADCSQRSFDGHCVH